VIKNPQIGEPLTGEALRYAISTQRTGTLAKNDKSRLWSGAPLVDPRTGQQYPSAIISAPYPEQDGTRTDPGPKALPGAILTGGIINITVGTREGGEFNRRVAVAGGRAIIGQLGRYPNVNVVTEKVNNTISPIVFSWIQAGYANGGEVMWDAPAFVDDGTGGKKFIPEGAAQVVSDTACNITFGIFVDGTERTLVVPTTVGAALTVPGSATYFAASTGAILYFRLSPL
jgi:hypothetical protein